MAGTAMARASVETAQRLSALTAEFQQRAAHSTLRQKRDGFHRYVFRGSTERVSRLLHAARSSGALVWNDQNGFDHPMLQVFVPPAHVSELLNRIGPVLRERDVSFMREAKQWLVFRGPGESLKRVTDAIADFRKDHSVETTWMARRIAFEGNRIRMQLVNIGSKAGYVPSNSLRLSAAVDPRPGADVVEAFFASLGIQADDVSITSASAGTTLRVVVPKPSAHLICDAQWILNTGSARFPVKFSADNGQQVVQDLALSRRNRKENALLSRSPAALPRRSHVPERPPPAGQADVARCAIAWHKGVATSREPTPT